MCYFWFAGMTYASYTASTLAMVVVDVAPLIVPVSSTLSAVLFGVGMTCLCRTLWARRELLKSAGAAAALHSVVPVEPSSASPTPPKCKPLRLRCRCCSRVSYIGAGI